MDSSKQNPFETGGHKLLPFTVLVDLSSTAIFVLQSTCILFDVIEDFRLLFHNFLFKLNFLITIRQLYFGCVAIKEVVNVWSPINTGHVSETHALERFLHKCLGPFDLHLSLHLPVPFTAATLNYVLK